MIPPLGLYVHLPWCERKCPYCDFNSHELSVIPEADYVTALLADLAAEVAGVAGREVGSVFIGGGTPSLFSATAIKRLLTGIREQIALAADAEITLEANPGSAEADKFAAFREAGVTRLSLGIQSFNDDCLRRLGRVHNAREAQDAVGYARAAGFDSFNIDLMHGLPGQTDDDALEDLATAVALKPPHLSWYQLTIEPNTTFYKRPPRLPDEDTLARIQSRGEALLQNAGLDQYEVSAWSRPGTECRHNLNYWTFGDYLGIGAGAHAKLTDRDGHCTRYTRRRQPGDYLGAMNGNDFIASKRTLTKGDLVGEFAMNALRLNAGFSTTLFEQRTGLPRSHLWPVVDTLAARGLLVLSRQHIAATPLGQRFLDSVVAAFFPDE